MGVQRLASVAHSAQRLLARFRGTSGLVALLLAGAFSALVVVADQFVSSWANGQVVIAWIALWALLFVALVLFTEATRGWPERLVQLIETQY